MEGKKERSGQRQGSAVQALSGSRTPEAALTDGGGGDSGSAAAPRLDVCRWAGRSVGGTVGRLFGCGRRGAERQKERLLIQQRTASEGGGGGERAHGGRHEAQAGGREGGRVMDTGLSIMSTDGPPSFRPPWGHLPTSAPAHSNRSCGVCSRKFARM